MIKKTLSILLTILTITAFSQKVGLVLSGGGAKGIAHIGVIKVLEENNIPIDYVTGTSIGAIIAGLYSMGMTPDEMIELFNSNDFKLWSTGRMDKDDLYYFRRNDEQPDWLKLDIAKKDNKVKIYVPFNLIPERQMDFAFLELTAQSTAACNGNFNNLMVPFRCVSSDIYNNRAVIHKNGDLGEAIRASMTFPFVYKPIEKDGILLFDGGMTNNFPTDVMQEEFAPDIIIGHKVSNMGDRYDTDDILSQIETMVTQLTNYEIPDSMGILLESKLDDVGLFDFPKANYINSRGRATALKNIDTIKALIKRRVPQAEVTKKRANFSKKKPELKFNNIQVEGVRDNLQRKYIIQSIKYKEKVIDILQLRSSYFQLIEDDQIKSIRPLAYYNDKTGLFDLHLKVEPRKPFDMEFGGHLSTRSNTFGFIQGNMKMFQKRAYNFSSNLFFGKFYNSFMIGGRMDSPSRTPYYISSYFTINHWDYLSTATDLIFTSFEPKYVKQTERNFRFEIGAPYSKTGIIDAGIASFNSSDKFFQVKDFNKGDDSDETKFEGFASHLRLDQKNYDFKQYATEGGRKMLKLSYINGDEDFTHGTRAPVKENIRTTHNYFQIEALYDQYFETSKYISVGVMAKAVFNNNNLFSNYTSSIINAPIFTPTPNSKSIFNEHYRAYHYFAAGGKFIYDINDILHLRTEVYGFFPIQSIVSTGNKVHFHEKFFSRAHVMGLGALVVHSRFGPLSAELNYYDKPGQKWFFSLNMGYMLFNKRGF